MSQHQMKRNFDPTIEDWLSRRVRAKDDPKGTTDQTSECVIHNFVKMLCHWKAKSSWSFYCGLSRLHNILQLFLISNDTLTHDQRRKKQISGNMSAIHCRYHSASLPFSPQCRKWRKEKTGKKILWILVRMQLLHFLRVFAGIIAFPNLQWPCSFTLLPGKLQV